MTPRYARRTLLCALAFALALGGCASGTALTARWHDPNWQAGPLHNVYVIAVRKDPVRRRLWEDGCVAALKQHGVHGTASYVEFPNAVPDTQQVIDAIQAHSYDGVVVSLRLENTQEQREVPGTIVTVPETRHNPYTGMYYTVYSQIETPGYTETDEIRRFQTDIWSTGENGRLIWSASAEVYDPISADVMQDLIGKKILPAAVKDGIFP